MQLNSFHNFFFLQSKLNNLPKSPDLFENDDRFIPEII